MIVAVLAASIALGAKPSLQDVQKKFPPLTLPITIKSLTPQKVKLTAAEVKALGFQRDGAAALAALQSWSEKPIAKGQKALWPIASVERNGNRLLLLQYDVIEPTRQLRRTFLLSYGENGELLGGHLFHEEIAGDSGTQTNVSTLDQVGVISRLITWKYPMTEAGLPEALVITSEARAKLTSKGAIESMAPAWSTRSGTYVDRKSGEELRVFEKRVFYRADAKAAFQELEGDGNTMRLEGTAAPYLLTWNDRRSDISAQNPEGVVQVFNRER